MAEITITEAEVKPGAGAVTIRRDAAAGEAVKAGEWVYFDKTVSQWKLSQTDGTEVQAATVGIAMNSATQAGQPLAVLTDGEADVGAGASIIAGEAYSLGTTAGKMLPSEDVLLLATHWSTTLCIGKASNRIQVKPNISGAQRA